MKIALFTDSFEEGYGGVTVYVRNLADYLIKHNHIVRVFVWESEWITVEERKICATFPALNIIKSVKGKVGLSTLKILREVESFSPDIIHNHSQFSMGVQAIIIAKRLNIPIINHYHTYLSGSLNHFPYPFKRYYKMTNKALEKETKFFFSLGDLVISPTRVMKTYLEKIGIKKEIKIIPFGINMKLFTKEERHMKKKFTVIYVGRLVKEKNVDKIINIFAEFSKDKDVLLKIVGLGIEKEDLEKLVLSLKINDKVQFTGWISRENLSREYNSSSLFVILSQMETFGISILEAMTCGLPIIGANVLAIPELIRDGVNGFLVEPSNSNGVLEKINEIYENQELELILSENSVALAEKYELSKVFGELEEVYLQLLK